MVEFNDQSIYIKGKLMVLKILILIIILSSSNTFFSNTNNDSTVHYHNVENMLYYEQNIADTDPYIFERCRLDLYYPSNDKDFKTIIWFHGGGLRAGEKSIPEELENKGLAVVAVNYRLFPKVKSPAYIEDAAASVAWVFKNIEKYGGNSEKIFLSGHSAGGYLVSMVGLDKMWLNQHNIDADSIAGLIPFSGHTITHFTIREERGIPGEQPIIDEFAPLYHVRQNAPPLILITGDREMELLGRYEENAFLMRMMKVVGHKQTFLYEIQGFNHGNMVEPAYKILLNFLQNR